MQRFFIIVTGWNCEASVERCVNSVIAQTHKDWYAIFVNDASEDKTGEILNRLTPKEIPIKNFWAVRHTAHNQGAAIIRHDSIKNLGAYVGMEQEIILFLGMDDELLPNALERIAQEYDNGKLMTYGNWVNQNGIGLPESFEFEYPDSVHTDRSYRKVKYRSTAPNTFRRFLYDVIKPGDLQLNGEWFKATTESEVMFSCLEQCGKDRIGVIKEPIYIYNQVNGGGARSRFGDNYQNEIYNHVISKPKRELWSQ